MRHRKGGSGADGFALGHPPLKGGMVTHRNGHIDCPTRGAWIAQFVNEQTKTFEHGIA